MEELAKAKHRTSAYDDVILADLDKNCREKVVVRTKKQLDRHERF